MGRGFRSGGGGGGSRGGGFSGGGRSSRSSFGGSSRGGFGGHHHHSHTVYIGPRRHHHHYYGGYGYGGSSSPLSGLIAVMIFFAIFLGIAGLGLRGNIAQEQEWVDEAIQDYNYYQDLIENAEEKGYIHEGIVVNKYYDNEVDKYYIEYRLVPGGLKYETFSVYTYEEAMALQNGGPIELALDRKFDVRYVNEIESIDVAFKNVELEEFSLYVITDGDTSSLKTASFVCLTISGVLIVLVIVIVVKSSKKSSTSTTSSTSTSGPIPSSSSSCKYCGTIHEPGTKKCNNCGAQLR